MPDMSFSVRGAEPVADAMTPMVALYLNVASRPADQTIQTLNLRCQIQIETPRRRYSDEEQAKLRDLFGEPQRWGQTLKPMLWTNVTAMVPSFTGAASFSLSVPCTFDLDVAVTKYFYGLQEGTVPVTLMFSGTVFYRSPSQQLQAAPISWNSEARYQLPVDVWKRSIDLHYSHSAWLRIRRDVFDRVYDLKVHQGFATFDETLEHMLETVQRAGV